MVGLHAGEGGVSVRVCFHACQKCFPVDLMPVASQQPCTWRERNLARGREREREREAERDRERERDCEIERTIERDQGLCRGCRFGERVVRVSELV